MDTRSMFGYSSFAANSLGDPFLNIPISDVDIGRESLPILELSTSFGRESLGILKLGCDLGSSNLSQNSFSYKTTSDVSSYNVLDNAFLLSSNRTSDPKSASTFSIKSSNFSFNIRDFEPSSIKMSDVSNSLLIRESKNKLNEGFLYTNEPSEPLLEKIRSRFYSLPVCTTRKEETNREYFIQQMINRVSESCLRINNNYTDEKVAEEASTFNDSVFIEARHLTGKFSEEGSNEGFILDETDPPELIDGDLEESKDDNKCDSNIIFKKIDTLLPVNGYHKLNEKLDDPLESLKQVPSTVLSNDSHCNSNITKEEYQKERTVENNFRRDNNEAQSTPTDLRKSKEVFQNLSKLLAKNNISDVEVEQGKTLLNTLSDMVGNGLRERSKSFSDNTVKSSSGLEKSQNSSNKIPCTSLPMIGHPDKCDNKISHKLSTSHSQNLKIFRSKLGTNMVRSNSFDKSKNNTALSTASESSIESKNLSYEHSLANLRPKKMSNTLVKRGPMKATIPVENFNNMRQKVTPPKTQQTLPKYSSRISTPIRAQLKPMAQSTPDNKATLRSSSMEQPRSFSSPNLQEKSSNYSTSLSSYKDSSISKDRSSLQKSNLPRRNSVSELRRSPLSTGVKRSNSMKESSLMKTMNKIRQNISSSGIIGKGVLRDSSNLSVKNVSMNSSGKISDISRRVVKTFGKENSSLV